MGKVGLCVCLVLVLAALSNAQRRTSIDKPGSCPPSSSIGICAFMCFDDQACPGNEKCCPTGCGGASCSTPVSQVRSQAKLGSCPSKPVGPWVCSHTCSTDADCRGKLKCCKNRCRALTCQKPEP